MSSQFDLARMEGGLVSFEFPKKNGGTIAISAHHPNQAEISASMHLSKIPLDESGNIERSKISMTEIIPRQDEMLSFLASFCIEEVSGLECWPEKAKRRGFCGLEELTDEAFSLIHVTALRSIGRKLYEKSSLSDDEKKAS